MLSYALDRCGYLKIQALFFSFFLNNAHLMKKNKFRTDPIPNCPEISFLIRYIEWTSL